MTTLLLTIITLLFTFTLSTATNRLHHNHHHHHHHLRLSNTPSSSSQQIQQSCSATRYPDKCAEHLSTPTANLTENPTPTNTIHSTLTISSHHLKSTQSMINDIISSSTSNLNLTRAAHLCLEILNYSTIRTSAVQNALSSHDNKLKDARAWASAALSYQYDCWSGLKYVNNTPAVNTTMSYIDTELIVSTSNALSMMNALDVYGNDSASWTSPKTERDGFWPPLPHDDHNGLGSGGYRGFWKGLIVNVTVCDEGCDFNKVQSAVDTSPKDLVVGSGMRYVVYVKSGVYKEIVRIDFNQRNLVLIGDGIGKTIITGDLSVGRDGISTYSTATFGVLGDGFMAYGITFENKSPPPTSQSVAFRSDSDLSYIENCEFLSNQDTLYSHSLRQLYNSCRIEGCVDFIFGNSAAVFLNCTILIRPRQVSPERGEVNAVTAHGRIDPAQLTGFSFLNCSVNGTDEYVKMYKMKPGVHRSYLGRPWKEYSRTVFINSELGEIVSPQGWLPWIGEFALKTLYYGEYGNFGDGAKLDKRVVWSSRIPEDKIGVYSVGSFIQGDEFSFPN